LLGERASLGILLRASTTRELNWHGPLKLAGRRDVGFEGCLS
jgi:hypothetical protein